MLALGSRSREQGDRSCCTCWAFVSFHSHYCCTSVRICVLTSHRRSHFRNQHKTVEKDGGRSGLDHTHGHSLPHLIALIKTIPFHLAMHSISLKLTLFQIQHYHDDLPRPHGVGLLAFPIRVQGRRKTGDWCSIRPMNIRGPP